ncbi:hypothetical protein B0T24DRAFT_683405 [Lasiosphaeria ovina]|uniref:Uncharacterized protein n=1 Tax=Lasiosphaeria ovina TaxID=92902 RepID=A0AAE0MYZ8_9PEZI|nr:hypothetical protein B0T24DRAFT_683405 [Lasiosphaeria ovina]
MVGRRTNAHWEALMRRRRIHRPSHPQAVPSTGRPIHRPSPIPTDKLRQFASCDPGLDPDCKVPLIDAPFRAMEPPESVAPVGQPAVASQIGGIDQFLRNVTDVLHQIEDNMLAPLLVNFWDAGIRASKRTTSLPEPERRHTWLHDSLQGVDGIVQLFRDHHTTANHHAIVQAIASIRDVFAEEELVQARRERGEAVTSREAIKTAKSLVDGELKEKKLQFVDLLLDSQKI